MKLAREYLQRPTVAREELIAKSGTGAAVWEERCAWGSLGSRKGTCFFSPTGLVFNCRLERSSCFVMLLFLS